MVTNAKKTAARWMSDSMTISSCDGEVRASRAVNFSGRAIVTAVQPSLRGRLLAATIEPITLTVSL